jgi:hypothetical protein
MAGLQETPVVLTLIRIDGREAGRCGAGVRVDFQHVAGPVHGPGQDGFHEVGRGRDADARMLDEIALPGYVQAADQVRGRSIARAAPDAAQCHSVPFAAGRFLGGEVGSHAPEGILGENDL